ncbi:hypothetical protein Q8A73_001199 [Channa argus]|nr:hypothetical protein Q8A73_001199 [Channa argus]
MTDRYNIHSQLEHLQSKYIGTGHADTSKWEWLVNQHRDSYCSYMGHFDLLNYFSVAENESKARVRFNLMEKMLQPGVVRLMINIHSFPVEQEACITAESSRQCARDKTAFPSCLGNFTNIDRESRRFMITVVQKGIFQTQGPAATVIALFAFGL